MQKQRGSRSHLAEAAKAFNRDPLSAAEQPYGSGPIPNDVEFSQSLIRRQRYVTATGPEELRDVLAAQRRFPLTNVQSACFALTNSHWQRVAGSQLQWRWGLPHFLTRAIS
jgi:hypothetical protein